MLPGDRYGDNSIIGIDDVDTDGNDRIFERSNGGIVDIGAFESEVIQAPPVIINTDGWAEAARVLASDAISDGYFGISVSIMVIMR